MTGLVDVLVRPSVLLTLGLVVSFGLRHHSAALRHLVLAASLLAAAATVPLGVLLPALPIPLPMPESSPPVLATPMAGAIAARTDGGERIDVTRPDRTRTLAMKSVAVLWAAGCLAMLSMLAAGTIRIAGVARRARRIRDARWIGAAADAASSLGLDREVVLLQTDRADLIATFGLRRSRLLLPAHAVDWTDERRRVVLVHEFAHVRRHDWTVQSAAEIVRALLWFNPLVWLVLARLRRESEIACDDAVIAKGVDPRAYARHLLELARLCRPGSSWVPGIPMAHPSTLERRFAAMLTPHTNRLALSRRAIVLTTLLISVAALPIAALRAGQASPAPLTGSVYDVSGAVLPGVELVLEDANQIKWVIASDANGRFEFPAVGPGRYGLEASLRGFRSLRHEFELDTARDWDRAITLQVADLRETIHVRAERPAAASRPAPASPGAPVRIGGNLKAPLKERDVRPVYPPAMREAGRTGVVPIEAIIGRDGRVASVRVLSAQVHPDFAIAAADAVRQWRFTPTLLNGTPVEVVMTVTVTFDLSE